MDKSIFLANIKALSKNQYEEAKLIAEHNCSLSDIERDVHANNMVNVKEEVESISPKGNMGVFFGVGNGNHFQYYINKYKPARVYFVEQDLGHLKYFLSKFNLSSQIAAGSVYIFTQTKSLYHSVYNVMMADSASKIMISSVDFIKNGSCLRKKSELGFTINFLQEFARACDITLQNYGNSPKDSLIGLENLLLNIKHTVENPGISSLKDSLKGIPGVVIAAGPSLQKNINLLPEMKNRAVLLAVDTSLKPLLKEGIYPDMVTSIERGKGVINYFTDLHEVKDRLKEETVFSCATVLQPKIFDYVKDEYDLSIMPVYRDFAHYRWLKNDKGIIMSGKSAANLAYCMLAYMGCDPIILVGQDLAFGEDDKTHVDGADHSINGMAKSHKIKEVLTVRGNYVPTLKTIKTWDLFRRFYETDIKAHNKRTINATEGGAYIEGTELMTLQEVVDTLIPDNSEHPAKIRQVFENFKINNDVENMKKVFLDGIEKLDNWEKVYKKGLEFALEGKIDKAKELRMKYMDTKDYTFYEILMHTCQSVLIRHELRMKMIKGDKDKEKDEYIWLFEVMIALVKVTRDYIKKGLDKLEE